jgi:hypothetical protein
MGLPDTMAKIIKKIPAVRTFDLPTGTFKAKLTQIRSLTKQTKRGPQEWVRFIFEVTVPSMPNSLPCAGRNFLLDLNPGSDLRNFLEVWLGDDFFAAHSNQELDFDIFLNKEGDICLSHFLGDGYEKPLVTIDNVFPANSLTNEPQTVLAPTLE